MNRLEKKCFIASTGLHLLLTLILLVGPAFLSSQEKPLTVQYIDIIPAKVIEGAFAGGGNPNAKPPPPAPPRREATPAPPPEPNPPPQKKETLEEPKPDSSNPEPSDSAKRKPQIDLSKTTTRNSNTKSTAKPRENTARQQMMQARANQAAMVNSALASLKDGLSSSTTIDIKGPGGEAYAGYLTVLQSIYQRYYDRELATAGELSGKESSVIVTVTVQRSGKVVNARLSTPSGIGSFDRLVRRVLEQVEFIHPFPEGSKDSERTFTIGFELRLNKAIG